MIQILPEKKAIRWPVLLFALIINFSILWLGKNPLDYSIRIAP